MDNKEQARIDISEDVAQGIYSNLVVVSHSSSDFMMDFVQLFPGMPAPKVRSRVILSPEHAKELMLLLNENIERFEERYGKITLQKKDVPSIEMFNTPKGEA